jgi:ParB family chromosome partitioning protein
MAKFWERLMTSTVAEKAGRPAEKDKDKVEKRRALGRGLESLLPGPRVVAGTSVAPTAPTSPLLAKDARNGAPGGSAPGQGSGTASEQQIPHFVRNDKALRDDKAFRDEKSSSAQPVGDIRAVVDGQTLAGEDPEQRSGGQPGAAVATLNPTSPLTSVSPSSPVSTSGPVSALSTAAAPWAGSASPRSGETIEIQAQAEPRAPTNLVVNIALDHIDKNPYQTRYFFDQELLEELADSIKANGVVQPVVVRPAEDGRYVLILGERRCRASKLAGKTTIPAIVKRVSDQQAAEMTVIENLQRQDLNCLEQAEAFRVLSQRFNLTQQQIGDRVGMSRESVSNYMRLLKLPQRTMEYLTNNKLGFSEARQLLSLEDPERIADAADEVVKKHMTIEQIEDMVMRIQGFVPPLPGQEKKQVGARWIDPNVRAAQTELERLLQVRVRIKDRKGKGKIVIEYATVDDYDRVVDALRGKKS